MWLGSLSVVVAATACGGGDGVVPRVATTAPAPSSVTTGTPESSVVLAATTVAGSNPSVIASSSPGPTSAPARWSVGAATTLQDVLAAMAGSRPPLAVGRQVFGLPLDVPLPAAALADGFVDAVTDTGGVRVTWIVKFSTTTAPAALEKLVADSFADPRWEVGARVESRLDSGTFVTLNRPASAVGSADGWGLLGLTISPDTASGKPTGRNVLEVGVSRTVSGGTVVGLGLPAFTTGWLSEVPQADQLDLAELRVALSGLSVPGVWLDATYHADRSRFATLAGFTLTLPVDRDLADETAPAVVRPGVRVEPTP